MVVFTVRQYRETDLNQIINVYKSAFAEPPWNEYQKCACCNVEYGKEELISADCKKCRQPLKLIEFWSDQEITKDLRYAQTQPDSIVLVAENNGLIGLTWGYRIPLDKYPFLQDKIPPEYSYMDEIAVNGNTRQKGIGTKLGEKYIETAIEQGLAGIVLRTDERNNASMTLFEKLGLTPIPDGTRQVYDPQHPNRIYLARRIK